MFTGIVEEIGTIQGIKKGARSCILTVGCSTVLDGTQIGGVKMHPKADPDLTIGFGMPGAADRKGAGSNVQMQLDF